jgi:hypothetical protein
MGGVDVPSTVGFSTWFDSYRRSFDAVWETAIPIAEADEAAVQSLAG